MVLVKNIIWSNNLEISEFISKKDDEISDIIKNKKNITLINNSVEEEYEIIRNISELELFLSYTVKFESDQIIKMQAAGGIAWKYPKRKAVVAFKIEKDNKLFNIVHNIYNIIFLELVFRDVEYLLFHNCIFRKLVSITNTSKTKKLGLHLEESICNDRFEISGEVDFVEINNTIFKNSGSVNIRCKTIESILIQGGIIRSIIQGVRIGKIQIIDSIISWVTVIDVIIENSIIMQDIIINDNGNLSFDKFIIRGYGDIGIKEILGKIQLKNTDFSNTKIDFRAIENNKYQCLLSRNTNNYIEEIENFINLNDIAEKCKNKKVELHTEYLIKKYQRLNRWNVKKGFMKLLCIPLKMIEKIIETSIGYFCKWEVMLRSIILIILSYSIIYFLFPDGITHPNTKNYHLSMLSLINGGLIEFPEVLSLLADSIYFSIITFVTIGYGDIVPNNNSIFRLIAGSEGLLGVIFVSFLTITITRRFTK